MSFRTAVRRNVNRTAVVRPKAFAAPVEGWDASSALANMKEGRAVQLKNWFPQPGYVEVRKGHRWQSWDIGSSPKTVSAIDTGTDVFTSAGHGMANGTAVKFHAVTTMPTGLSATRIYYVISATTDEFSVATSVGGSAVDVSSSGSGTITVYEIDDPSVETLAVWQGPSTSKMFAGAGGALWDVTSTAAATFSRTAGGSNRWQWWNHTTSAGSFLFMVNGSDAPLHYNGSTWTAPSITGITPSDIITGITHKKRIWFVLKDSTKAAYLATEAVAGAATTFELGSLFTRGGYLLALATWTRDGGSGADDYFVAISSRGQVAIYQGTDPAAADTWGLVGVFDVPTPIGRRCFTRFGADVLLMTLEGVFPLSQLLAVDQSQARRKAVTENISSAFNTQALSYASLFGWEACVYPKGTRLIVNVPTVEGSTAVQYVMNTLTGAWCEYDSHNANTWVVYNDNLYFGGNDGDVYRADTGSADVDQPITAVGQTAYSAFGSGALKRFSMIKPLIIASGSNRPALGVSIDFTETQTLSTATSATSTAGATWDSGTWDASVWGGADVQVSDWSTLSALGVFASLKFQAQTGVTAGGSNWGVSEWGSSLWGSAGQSSETMQIQGFVVLHEQGDFL